MVRRLPPAAIISRFCARDFHHRDFPSPTQLRPAIMLSVSIVALGLVARPPMTQPRSQVTMVATSLEAQSSDAATSVMGALVGASTCALAGAGLAAATSDGALAMLGSTGMFDQDVLFTDLLVQGYDAGNTAGYAVLALSLMIAIASPEAWDSAAVLATEEIDACLLDYDSDGPICGKATFEDGLTCIEQYTNGQTRWVCA